MTTLPLLPDEITAAWLRGALEDGSGRAQSLTDARLDGVIAGSTTKVFVRLATENGTGALPDSLCIKGVLDEPRTPVRVLGARQEATFFAQLAPTLDIPQFRTWFAAADAHQGIVVFDDLRATDTSFTKVGATWSPDRVAAALEVQAAWHAATWQLPQARYPWLVKGNQVLLSATDALFSEPHWSAHLGDPATVDVPRELADRERMEAAVRRLFELQAQATHALSHGDAHIGNTYLDAAGQPAFYDWQTFCLAPALDDVTYFIGGALPIEARRQHERDLLQHYLDALAGHDGPEVEWDAAWLDYRRYQIHGFFWAVPTAWQPPECSVPMAERYIAGIKDHDTLALLA